MADALASVVEEDAAHGFGRGGVIVPTVLPGDFAWPGEAQECFVDEGGGGEGVAGPLVRDLLLGGGSELVVDEGHELCGR